MKLRSFFFLLVTIFLLNPTFAQRSLNVMTFNIRLDTASDSLNNWQYRKENLVSQVLHHRTSLLGVQEALENQMQDLQGLLKGWKHVGVPRDNSKGGEYSAIFYDSARLSLIEQNTFWLSENIYKKGIKGWDAALPRIVTWAKFRDNLTKKVFYIFNTHFDHKGKIARRESAKLLLKQIETIAGKYPVIAMGDFNAPPSDEPIKIITDNANPLHLTDAKSVSVAAHYGPTGTFNGFTSGETTPDPIDYIFIKNEVRVLSHATFSQTWNGRFSSDHFPVFAEIVF